MGVNGLSPAVKDNALFLLQPGKIMATSPGTTHFFPGVADQALSLALGIHPRPDEKEHYLYDPFCGNGTILTVATIMERERIKRVIGSDINPDAIQTTRANLGLCSSIMLRHRLAAVKQSKDSDDDPRLPGRLRQLATILEHADCRFKPDAKIFEHDMLQPIPDEAIPAESISMVVTDPPHGRQIPFISDGEPIREYKTLDALYLQTLARLRPALQDGASLALVCSTRERVLEVLACAPEYTYKGTRDGAARAGSKDFMFAIHLLKAA